MRPPRPEQRKLALGLPKAGQEVRGRACCTPALGGEEEREGGPWENISASEPGPLGFPEGSPASFTEAHWGKLWEISMKDRKPEARLFPENVGIVGAVFGSLPGFLVVGGRMGCVGDTESQTGLGCVWGAQRRSSWLSSEASNASRGGCPRQW